MRRVSCILLVSGLVLIGSRLRVSGTDIRLARPCLSLLVPRLSLGSMGLVLVVGCRGPVVSGCILTSLATYLATRV